MGIGLNKYYMIKIIDNILMIYDKIYDKTKGDAQYGS